MVVGVLHKGGILAGGVGFKHERTGADGVCSGGVVLPDLAVVEDVLGKDEGAVPAETGHETHVGGVHMERHSVGIDDLDRINDAH